MQHAPATQQCSLDFSAVTISKRNYYNQNRRFAGRLAHLPSSASTTPTSIRFNTMQLVVLYLPFNYISQKVLILRSNRAVYNSMGYSKLKAKKVIYKIYMSTREEQYTSFNNDKVDYFKIIIYLWILYTTHIV